MLELILEAVHSSCRKAVSQSPNIAIFKNFKTEWPDIKHLQFKTALDDPKITSIIKYKRDNILTYIKETLSHEKQPRNHYKELLLLTAIFFGVGDKNKILCYSWN